MTGTVRRLPIVGVMGSSARAHEELAVPLGRSLARLGAHLLTGGGQGVMASVSRAFAEVEDRAGLVLGVLPFRDGAPDGSRPPGDAPGQPNRWIEVAVRTHLGRDGADPSSRNHVNVLTSDVVVALPGGEGTASEVELAVRYGRPVVLFGDPDRARCLPAQVAAQVAAASSVSEVIAFARRSLPAGLAAALAPERPQPSAAGTAPERP